MLADMFTNPLQGSLFKSFCNSILNISDPALSHQDGNEHRSVLGITHVGFHVGRNMVESRSEQIVHRKNHIIETLQRTHSYWSNPVQDKLCGPEKVISWSDPVAVVHWYTCQMTMAHSQTRIG